MSVTDKNYKFQQERRQARRVAESHVELAGKTKKFAGRSPTITVLKSGHRQKFQQIPSENIFSAGNQMPSTPE